MNLSINWLGEFVALPADLGELEDILTRSGLSVEGRRASGVNVDSVVVARIIESNPHPNADRLSVCQVEDGSGRPRQIVCGAKNYAVGDKVPLALPGAVLPGGFKIKSGKLRGEKSDGMLCSATELGLGEDAKGLLILDPAAEIGKPIGDLFETDTILELEITPNRGDWLSHLGVAREVAAFTDSPLLYSAPAALAHREAPDEARIEPQTPCPFYSVLRINGVRVGPSPGWLRRRLEALGVRSINNIVDVTNLVMLELGQPLHAFDAAKVRGGIVVRRAAADESLELLDGRTVRLRTSDCVIADQARALALGGVMGGADSGVTENTTDILLESAWFVPSAIRKTARDLEAHTDSSHRFERGVDPLGVLPAAARAAALIMETAGGTAAPQTAAAGKPPWDAPVIELRHARCRALLGRELADADIRGALRRAGMSLAEESENTTRVNVPSFRLDLTREADLIEEVARLTGIEGVPSRLVFTPAPAGAADRFYDQCMHLRHRLCGMGFTEARTSSLVSPARAAEHGDLAVRLRNPLGEEQAFLRPSLAPGLIEAAKRNFHLGQPAVRLFEIGRVFSAEAPGERMAVALLASGPVRAGHWGSGDAEMAGFFDLKGVVENLFPEYAGAVPQPPAAGEVLRAGVDHPQGHIAQLSPEAAAGLDGPGPVCVAEILLLPADAADLAAHARELPKFPASGRDIALVVPESVSYAAIAACIRANGGAWLEAFAPFDVFRDPQGNKLPADRKSVAISLVFRNAERTLTHEEVDAACEAIRKPLREELGAEFRE